jgi:hypothetical protein
MRAPARGGVRRPLLLLLLPVAALLLVGAPAGGAARTLFGFFPSPPVMTTESVIATFRAIGEHADLVLFARNVPWTDFADGDRKDSADIAELTAMVELARANLLEPAFVIDPLNGLDRSRFMSLPQGWTPSFGDPRVRSAMTSYALRIVREFHPRFLGLASEINTYQDRHPDDFPSFMGLYGDIYDAVKAAAPQTRVFVTFQWEEINNLISGVDAGRRRYDTRWEQIRAFEPRLDVWAISTYPFVAFRSARDIPADYYARLARYTEKPLAVAEGGYTTEDVQVLRGTPEDQVLFLRSVHDQVGARLAVWIYTVLSDFSLDSYAPFLRQQGIGGDIPTLGWFAHIGLRGPDGTPKPGLAVWDSFRAR